MSILLILAFFSVVWLIGLPAYWLFFSSPAERRGVTEKLEWYRTQPIWPHGILKVIFVLLNAWVLFPVKGTAVSICLIASFVIAQQ